MDPALETARAKRRGARLPGNYRATVVAAPDGPAGTLVVRFVGDPRETTTIVRHWRPRHDGTLPPAGATALISSDSAAQYWLVDWDA